jgi:hypothetical protein
VELPSSQSLTLEELSQAWQVLSSLNDGLEEYELPSNLQHLSDWDWNLLGMLLNREMWLRKNNPLH